MRAIEAIRTWIYSTLSNDSQLISLLGGTNIYKNYPGVQFELNSSNPAAVYYNFEEAKEGVPIPEQETNYTVLFLVRSLTLTVMEDIAERIETLLHETYKLSTNGWFVGSILKTSGEVDNPETEGYFEKVIPFRFETILPIT